MLKKVNDSFDARTEPMVYKIEKNIQYLLQISQVVRKWNFFINHTHINYVKKSCIQSLFKLSV